MGLVCLCEKGQSTFLCRNLTSSAQSQRILSDCCETLVQQREEVFVVYNDYSASPWTWYSEWGHPRIENILLAGSPCENKTVKKAILVLGNLTLHLFVPMTDSQMRRCLWSPSVSWKMLNPPATSGGIWVLWNPGGETVFLNHDLDPWKPSQT